MASLLAQKALARVFGGGLAGTVVAAGGSWLAEQIAQARSRQPDTVDTSSLKPGESLVVTVRPPMSRAERKLRAAADKLDTQLAAQTRPSRVARKTARKIAATQRKRGKAGVDTKAASKLAQREVQLWSKYDAATVPTRREARLREAIALVSARQAEERERTMSRSKLVQARPSRREIL